MVSLKTCFKCKLEKPRTQFYKHKMMGDGLLGKCKDCTKKDVAENRIKNIEKVREYDRARAKEPHRRALAREITAEWARQDLRRRYCHTQVRRAVLSGRLKRSPCVRCGSEKSLAHHESYDRPLDVVWFCQPCHKQRHKEMVLQGIIP